MTDEYIYVAGQDGAIYEVLPTDALLNFLQRLAADETDEYTSAIQEPEWQRAEVAYS